jgi:hypothetical protein
MTDGTKRDFPSEHRPGGSYTNSVRAEGSFLVVKDVWDKETWFPNDKVERVETEPTRRGW